MVAYPEEDHPPLEAALKYLVLSGVGSTIMLFGMALIYHSTGALGFAELAASVTTGDRADLWLVAGQVLFIIGIAFKLSLIPFHMWTPDVYQGAPAPVTGYLATVSKAAVFAVLLRFALDAQLLEFSSMAQLSIGLVLAIIAVLSMVIGNVLALLQDSIKRLLAYSSIAHVGYLMIAILVLNALPEGAMAVETALVFLAGYLAMTLAAFAVVSELSSAAAGERDSIDEYAGLFWRRPVLAAVLTAALLSLAGIPLTAGFIAKFYLFAAGVEGALWGLLWALILGSALSIYYYLKIVFAMTVRGDRCPSRSDLRRRRGHGRRSGPCGVGARHLSRAPHRLGRRHRPRIATPALSPLHIKSICWYNGGTNRREWRDEQLDRSIAAWPDPCLALDRCVRSRAGSRRRRGCRVSLWGH